ncbi:MAG: SGNH/GDSL hydrolase family protein [Draconibacterium sp.]|nr:SGNH/GDSL hydrolase family protein [Draconibacterium sp.]
MRFISLFVIVLVMISCSRSSSTLEKTSSYLALGDSYTIGESVPERERFPVQLSILLNEAGIKTESPKIIATTGWTTDELAEGIRNEKLNQEYNLVTLLIGVNNQYRGRDTAEYRLQFAELLQTAISFGAKNPKSVIVVSIPDYGVTPFAKDRNPEKIAREIDIFNQINKEESEITGTHYVNITPISKQAKTDSTLVAPDGLHPSGKMYSLWTEEILPVAKQILTNQNK